MKTHIIKGNLMGKFSIEKTFIDGLLIITPTVYQDSRGYFMETFNDQDFKSLGIDECFVQENQSFSTKGVLRGLHFQTRKPQGKLVRVIKGQVYDVAVDIRKSSPTFGRWHGVILSDQNKKQFYIPAGFAHGFLVLSETAEFCYKCTDYYDPGFEGGIIWNDKDLAIDWEKFIPESQIILSDKDKANSALEDLN